LYSSLESSIFPTGIPDTGGQRREYEQADR
jgi:hypothetical protein